MYKTLGLLLLIPTPLMADPLDRGEAYTTRGAPPQWMDNIDLGLLLLDYTIFGVTVAALGWLLMKKPTLLLRLENRVRTPFAAIFRAADHAGGVAGLLLQLVGTVVVFLALAAAVFVCQWLKHIGLGAISMAGLGLLALLLVRVIRGGESPHM